MCANTHCHNRRQRLLLLWTVSHDSDSTWPPPSTTSSSWVWFGTKWRSKRSASLPCRSCWSTNCSTRLCLLSALRLSSSLTTHRAGKHTYAGYTNGAVIVPLTHTHTHTIVRPTPALLILPTHLHIVTHVLLSSVYSIIVHTYTVILSTLAPFIHSTYIQ